MALFGTYNYPDIIKGADMPEVSFALSTSGVPIDLTGATIEMSWRCNGPSGRLQATWTNTSGITITNAANGEFKTNEQTIDWVAGTYYYDIKITDASNIVYTYVRGELVVFARSTH